MARESMTLCVSHSPASARDVEEHGAALDAARDAVSAFDECNAHAPVRDPDGDLDRQHAHRFGEAEAGRADLPSYAEVGALAAALRDMLPLIVPDMPAGAP